MAANVEMPGLSGGESRAATDNGGLPRSIGDGGGGSSSGGGDGGGGGNTARERRRRTRVGVAPMTEENSIPRPTNAWDAGSTLPQQEAVAVSLPK